MGKTSFGGRNKEASCLTEQSPGFFSGTETLGLLHLFSAYSHRMLQQSALPCWSPSGMLPSPFSNNRKVVIPC